MTVVGVIGAGTMGAGIAQVAATHGCAVTLTDVNTQVVRKAIEGIAARLERLVAKKNLSADERIKILDRLRVASGPESFADCSLIVEAVAEKLEVKVAVLAALKPALRPRTILASNTSSLSISQIGQGLGEGRRVVGMHFFNPAPLMPLVEVIAGNDNDSQVVDQVAEYARSWGKTVVRAKDSPGFIVNRVARGFYLESLRMLGEGVAAPDEIDRTMRELGGFRLGPFELMDLVGIDINYSVSSSVWEQLGRPVRLKPHPIQADLYEKGHLGRKTQRGFYRYNSDGPVLDVKVQEKPLHTTPALREAVEAFTARAAQKPRTPLENYVFARVLVTIINEAALALDDEVATKEDIDTAMRLGTNYPQGPVEWARRIGTERCVRLLQALNDTAADRRFSPAQSLMTGRF
jgi:3-hydroxybutyryl-CoA dehydrogenase